MPFALTETRRLEVLHDYDVLDTPSELELDELTALAAHICETPICVLSLIDENRQWFKSKVGLELDETPRDISFCAHALRQPDLFIVPDATRDDRFARSPMVEGEVGIRFYAGVPLVTPEERAPLGVFCVMDNLPRTLTESQLRALRVLGRQAMTHLELRRKTRELARARIRSGS